MSAVLPPQGGPSFTLPQVSLPDLSFGGIGATRGNTGPKFPGDGKGAKRGVGLAVVVLFHVLLAWALASGLGAKAIAIVKKPIQMVIVPEDIAPPPPPPPPPKIEKIKDMPKVQTPPPPAYVPPPEVVPAVAPPAPVIQAVQAEPPKEPVRIEPPPPPAPPVQQVQAPPPPPAVVKQDVALACPGYKDVLPNILEDVFERVGTPGTVVVQLKVKGNQVVDVVPLSGPKEYYKLLPALIKRALRCSAGGDAEVQTTLPLVFQR